MNALDPVVCRRARLARDHRFDGEFFLAVTTTGIYCRPVCPARPPRESNVRYYRSAAEAAQAGFRPCLRCRPESAPMSPAWRGTDTTVGRALQLIHEGYLNKHSLAQLAARLGVGERYLRKLFEQKLGVAPSTVAQTQRLHFAQKLLLESGLSITEIAFASGFGSLRRFNSATREAFGCAAGELRRRPGVTRSGKGITLELSYRPPYDWPGVFSFFERHAINGLEAVQGNNYQRTLRTDKGVARVSVTADEKYQRDGKHALRLELQLSDNSELTAAVATVRRMFDLDAQPAEIAGCLAEDHRLAPLVKQFPGIRSPTTASPFESCVRAVLGQQVSTVAAKTLCANIVAAANSALELDGIPVLVFPTPSEMLAVPDSVLKMPGSRRQTFRAICEFFAAADERDAAGVLNELADVKGIGPWTVSLLGMRGYGQPDHFPDTDLGLVKAAESLGIQGKQDLRQRSRTWQPWRSYAANLLWRSLSND